MNYIIFKADGSVDKQNFDYYVNQGNVGSQFFVGFPTVALHTAVAVPILPNGESSNTFQGSLESSYEYADGETSDGWLFTIPSACTTYNGLLRIAIYIADSSNVVVVSYPIGLIINETGVKPDTDTGVTIEEINSYLVYLSSLPTMADVNGKVDKVSTPNVVYCTKSGGVQGTNGYGVSTNTGILVQRDTNGNIRLPLTPSGNEMATSKKYVDDTITSSIASKANDDEVVHIAGSETITGAKTFSGTTTFTGGESHSGTVQFSNSVIINNFGGAGGVLNLSYAYVTTNSKTYFARVGVTSNQYVYYDLPKNYSDLGSEQHLTIATEDYVTTQIASAISNVYKIQAPKTVTELNALTLSSSMVGYVYNVTTSGTLTAGSVTVVAGDNVVVVESGGSYVFDKLAGTIDLSGYVQTSRTIAGIALSSDITAQALTDALALASNTDIDNLF